MFSSYENPWLIGVQSHGPVDHDLISRLNLAVFHIWTFKKCGDLWLPEEEDYSILACDISKILPSPEMVPMGTRLFYNFSSLFWDTEIDNKHCILDSFILSWDGNSEFSYLNYKHCFMQQQAGSWSRNLVFKVGLWWSAIIAVLQAAWFCNLQTLK